MMQFSLFLHFFLMSSLNTSQSREYRNDQPPTEVTAFDLNYLLTKLQNDYNNNDKHD